MIIADLNIRKACIEADRETFLGLFPSGEGQITHIEVGIKSQKGVRDTWIKSSDERGYLAYLFRTDIIRDKQG